MLPPINPKAKRSISIIISISVQNKNIIAIDRDMSSLRHPLFLPFLLIVLLYRCCWTAQAISNTFVFRSCYYDSPVTPGSQVAKNIRRLVPELVSKAALNGHVVTTYGSNKYKVYGSAQCRGDISNADCGKCVAGAVQRLAKECPNLGDVRIWYSYCFVRYSVENFLGKVDTGFGVSDSSKQNVTDPVTFNKTLGGLFTKIESQAVMPGNHRLFGTGQVKLSKSTTLYALVQCTEDLSPANCTACLKFSVAFLPELCGNHTGCYWTCSTCFVRYDLKKFFFPLNTTIIVSS
ncbi:hypothetical protein SAY87_006569 [Trapa incisa]|uniref:Gnk2-homologous domain-containing protein n=1 Tax=Trapa incisa TaxID=236973 RepID=A0AAN7K162_9MYRT|nr:hypothetical protein SAY87_006569 [Trapa incisa]